MTGSRTPANDLTLLGGLALCGLCLAPIAGDVYRPHPVYRCSSDRAHLTLDVEPVDVYANAVMLDRVRARAPDLWHEPYDGWSAAHAGLQWRAMSHEHRRAFVALHTVFHLMPQIAHDDPPALYVRLTWIPPVSG